MATVHIERKGSNRITVDWTTPNRIEWGECLTKIRKIAGRNFAKASKTWTVPLDYQVCQQLRALYGRQLVIGPELFSWAHNERRRIESLGSIAIAESAELVNLPKLNYELYRALYVGPKGKGLPADELEELMDSMENGSYQTADVRYLVDSIAPLNANQPGLGKTIEVLGALYEGGWHTGVGLVICPKVAVDSVWQVEMERWCPDIVAFPCVGNRAQREAVVAQFRKHSGPKALIVNPAMVQYRKDSTNKAKMVVKAKKKDLMKACLCKASKDPHWHYEPTFNFMDVKFDYLINDEVHKGNVRNHRSLTARSVNEVKVVDGGKVVAMSGTPMKKKGADIWGVLHYLRPDVFTSYWNFAERFFEIDENEYGKKVLGLREDVKEQFYEYLTPYMLRRTKAECAPWLPDKFYVDVLCQPTPKQRKQYDAMEDDAAVKLEGGGEISTTGVLDQFTRLRQFANSFCVMRNGKLIPSWNPTAEDSGSGKLDKLMELLEERGIFDGEREEKVIVFSQFEEMVTVIHTELLRQGVEAVRITGKENKAGQRKAIQDAFQAQGGPKVIVMTTTAGGVAITLDAADTVIFMDETWSPDEMEQAEDRAHRVSRIHQVSVYVLRTAATVDAYIHDTSADKAFSQAEILDLRRKWLRDRVTTKAA